MSKVSLSDVISDSEDEEEEGQSKPFHSKQTQKPKPKQKKTVEHKKKVRTRKKTAKVKVAKEEEGEEEKEKEESKLLSKARRETCRTLVRLFHKKLQAIYFAPTYTKIQRDKNLKLTKKSKEKQLQKCEEFKKYGDALVKLATEKDLLALADSSSSSDSSLETFSLQSCEDWAIMLTKLTDVYFRFTQES